MNDPNSNGPRVRSYILYDHRLIHLLDVGVRKEAGGTRWANLPTITGLPKGAKIDRVYYDDRIRGLIIDVEHESFDPVPSGCLIPRADDSFSLKYNGFQIIDDKIELKPNMDRAALLAMQEQIKERLYDLDHPKGQS